jgi:hypothetical protein
VAHNPGIAHVRALQHVFRYLLATTPRIGLLYEKPATLAEYFPVGWTGANYAPNYNAGVNSFKDNYRSTSAYIFTCNGTVVTWRIAAPAGRCDSETYAAAAAAKEAVHLRRLLAIPDEVSPPVVLLGDKKSSIKAAENGMTRADPNISMCRLTSYVRNAGMGLYASFTCRARKMFRMCLAKTFTLHTPSFDKFRAAMRAS